jgi:hypothetical protein
MADMTDVMIENKRRSITPFKKGWKGGIIRAATFDHDAIHCGHS